MATPKSISIKMDIIFKIYVLKGSFKVNIHKKILKMYFYLNIKVESSNIF